MRSSWRPEDSCREGAIDECELQPDRSLASGGPVGPGGDGADDLGLSAPDEGDLGRLAMAGPGPPPGGGLALRDRGPEAVGADPPEKGTVGLARLPDRLVLEHG